MLKVENLTKTYDKRSKNANTVLHGISFTLPDTGFVCILGPSGCGKTSLLNAIGGLDRFDSGKISYDGRDLKHCGSNAMEKERNLSFGYIFQNYHLLPEHSVMYNVYIGMHSLKLSHKEKIKRAKEVLASVEATARAVSSSDARPEEVDDTLISFDDCINEQVIEELKAVDINTLSPYEAGTYEPICAISAMIAT